MDHLLMLARLLLAIIFAVAASAKFMDRVGTQRAIIEFGLAPKFVNPVLLLLPIVEIAVGYSLLLGSLAKWGALAALALFVTFITAILVNLAQGRSPNCGCFGKLYPTTASLPTLIRDVMLAVVSGFILWPGWGDVGPDVVTWLSRLSPTQFTGLFLGLGLLFGMPVVQGRYFAFLRIQYLRSTGAYLRPTAVLPVSRESTPGLVTESIGPTAGLPVGIGAPQFELSTLDGGRLSLDALRTAGKRIALIFLDHLCSPCDDLLPAIGRWQRDYEKALTLALIAQSQDSANQLDGAVIPQSNVLLQERGEVAKAYQVPAVPSAIIIEPDGRIGSRLAVGKQAIWQLLTNSVPH